MNNRIEIKSLAKPLLAMAALSGLLLQAAPARAYQGMFESSIKYTVETEAIYHELTSLLSRTEDICLTGKFAEVSCQKNKKVSDRLIEIRVRIANLKNPAKAYLVAENDEKALFVSRLQTLIGQVEGPEATVLSSYFKTDLATRQEQSRTELVKNLKTSRTLADADPYQLDPYFSSAEQAIAGSIQAAQGFEELAQQTTSDQELAAVKFKMQTIWNGTSTDQKLVDEPAWRMQFLAADTIGMLGVGGILRAHEEARVVWHQYPILHVTDLKIAMACGSLDRDILSDTMVPLFPKVINFLTESAVKSQGKSAPIICSNPWFEKWASETYSVDNVKQTVTLVGPQKSEQIIEFFDALNK